MNEELTLLDQFAMRAPTDPENWFQPEIEWPDGLTEDDDPYRKDSDDPPLKRPGPFASKEEKVRYEKSRDRGITLYFQHKSWQEDREEYYEEQRRKLWPYAWAQEQLRVRAELMNTEIEPPNTCSTNKTAE